MKKIMIIGTLLATSVAFGAGNQGNGMMGRPGKGGMMGGANCSQMSPEQYKAMQADRIVMQEKHLEVQKLMLADKPDWNKIEKLNKEIAELKAKNMTNMMKFRKEAQPVKSN